MGIISYNIIILSFMRKNISLVIGFLFSIYSADGATVNITNGFGSDTQGVADNAGVLLNNTTGVVALGTFLSGDSAVTSATSSTTLLAGFTEFGTSASTFDDPGASIFGNQGVFDISGSSTDGTTFEGQSIYLVVGNSTSLSAASEFFVYRFDQNFLNVTGPGITDLVLGDDTGSVVFGAEDTVNLQAVGSGPFSTPNPVFETAGFTAVPEPSSIALLGLGVFGFVIRRRR